MKKILGAHNANTYLKPRKWWMRLINFTSKCQKLTITEQLEHGVRYFDFRIRLDEKKVDFINCHGLVEYESSVNALIEDISSFCRNTKEHVHIRFVYDDTFIKRTYDSIIYDSLKVLLYFTTPYNLSWEIIRKSDWKKITDSENNSPLEMVDCFRNYRGYKWIPWPRWWAKKNNKRLKKFMDEYQKGTPDKDTVFLFDFVDQST